MWPYRSEHECRRWCRWDQLKRQMGQGFSDLAQAVTYITSHDTQDPGEWRYMNEVLAALLQAQGWTDTSTSSIRAFVAGLGQAPPQLSGLVLTSSGPRW
jgi:hypothetical protein